MCRTSRVTMFAAILLMVGFSQPLDAQTVDDVGQWNAVFTQGKLGQNPHSRLKWWFDGHLRFLEDADGFNQSIIRPGIGWGINKNSALWAGYGWIRTSPFSGDDFDEHRIWQQWTWSKDLSPFKVAAELALNSGSSKQATTQGCDYVSSFASRKHFPPRYH